jgi:hypothetical protein
MWCNWHLGQILMGIMWCNWHLGQILMGCMWCNWHLGETLPHSLELCRLFTRPHNVQYVCLHAFGRAVHPKKLRVKQWNLYWKVIFKKKLKLFFVCGKIWLFCETCFKKGKFCHKCPVFWKKSWKMTTIALLFIDHFSSVIFVP